MLYERIRSFVVCLLYVLQFDRIIDAALMLRTRVKVLRYRRRGIPLNFVGQGGYDLEIAGAPGRFEIDPTSHLKSGTFIECSGGVKIGRYFHVGRGLTVFSSSHDYKGSGKIPYDGVDLERPVTIGDFVWCGANVTILPGVTIGEGAVIGAGSVVTRDVAPLSVVAGNPASVVGQRDRARYEELKAKGAFFA